jgi:hypothetical protein
MILIKNLLYISLTIITLHAASIDYHKSASEKLEICLKKCHDNWNADINFRALEAGSAPILAKVLEKNNLSMTAAILKGFALTDAFFRPNSYEGCIKECDFLYPSINAYDEANEKLINQLEDKVKDLSKEIQGINPWVNWSRKNKQTKVGEKLKNLKSQQDGLKNEFEAAIAQFEEESEDMEEEL